MPAPSSTATEPAHRAQERRLRRQAARQGLQLVKSRSKTSQAVEFGGYMLVDPMTNGLVAGGSPVAYSLGLEDVEEHLADLV